MKSGSPRPSARGWIRFAAVVLCVGAGLGACTDFRREDGEPCLKSSDCLSDLCSASICASPAPALPPGSGYGAPDAAGAAQDTGATPADTGATPDTSTGGDAASDGPPAGGNDASSGDALFLRADFVLPA